MNNQFPTITKCINMDGMKIEVCHGEIPDVCRLLRFGPVTEFELPDAKATDEEFQDWLLLYRKDAMEITLEWCKEFLPDCPQIEKIIHGEGEFKKGLRSLMRFGFEAGRAFQDMEHSFDEIYSKKESKS